MGDRPQTTLSISLWLVVLLEAILPVPGLLTVGAVWVLLARPPWFARLIEELYRQ